MSNDPSAAGTSAAAPATAGAQLRFFTDPRCLEHRAPAGYPEKPERLAGILAALRRQGLPLDETSSPDSDDAVSRAVAAVHSDTYVRRFESAVARGDGLLDSADNPLCPATWEAAKGSIDAGLRAVDWALAAPRRRAFAAVRPPGHHANAVTAMGFCYFSNIAVAAQYALDRHGAERVAIVDFDVHHGNGTQDVFYHRGDVLFVSLHQYPFYPGTGAASEVGEGEGEGATLNLPLVAGSGDDELMERLEGEVVPALRRFAPDLLLVSAGFDAWRGDPLGGLRVSEAGYARIGRILEAAADELCNGRVVSFLEGGYDVANLPSLVLAHAVPERSRDAPAEGS